MISISDLEQYLRTHDVESVTLTYTASAGALLRGQLKRAIQSFCWGRGFDLTVEESRGFFESVYQFKITVPAADALDVKRGMDAWVEKLNQGMAG